MSYSHNPRGGGHSHPGDRSGSGRGGQGVGPSRQPDDEIRRILQSPDRVVYRDDPNHIRPQLLDGDAQQAAEDLAKISTTQLRRFFEQVSAIKRRLDLDQRIADAEILAQVAFLKASAAYAAGRDRQNTPLPRFIVKHANSIANRRDFLDFHRHFETVIAFHKVFTLEKKGN